MNYMIIPKFLAYDVNFGVNKERRNLFLISGPDRHNKIFTCFSCFMISKEAMTFHWILRIAVTKLLIEHALISVLHATKSILCISHFGQLCQRDHHFKNSVKAR